MHDIIEHYGKVVVALAGVLAAVLLTVAVVSIVNSKTKTAVENISYEKQITDAIDGVEQN
jgi:NADH:ubiquinone oxidoreductase subunit 3 (subunit A)